MISSDTVNIEATASYILSNRILGSSSSNGSRGKQGRHEQRRYVTQTNRGAVRDDDVGVLRLGRNESRNETTADCDSVNTEKLQISG